MLGWRLLISAILIPALFVVFYFDAKAGETAPWLLGLSVLIAARGAWEMSHLLRTRSFSPSVPLVMACSVATVAANWYGRFGLLDTPPSSLLDGVGPALVAFALSLLAVFLSNAIRYREPGTSMETLGAEVLTVAYLGVLLSFAVQLRWVAGAEAGYYVLASLLIATKAGDIGAYTFGRLWGRRKMVPRLSPGKTWMGGLGALVGSGLGAYLWLHFAIGLFPLPPEAKPPVWIWCVVYGMALGVVGLIGDLCESLIKRDVGKKDSAALLPGFGGLLDLIDSVLYAAPVAWLLWALR